MTAAGAGLGMDPYAVLVPVNRFAAREEPVTIPVARCTCGVYGCGVTDAMCLSSRRAPDLRRLRLARPHARAAGLGVRRVLIEEPPARWPAAWHSIAHTGSPPAVAGDGWTKVSLSSD